MTLHRPGLAPAGDLLLCCTTKKKARKRTPLPRPLRGFPPSGRAGRGSPAQLFEPEGRVLRRPPVVSSAGQSAEGRPVKPGRLLCLLSWRSKKEGRPPGRDPANVTPNTGKPSRKGLTRRRSNGMNHQGSHNVWKALPPTGETLQARRVCQE